MINSTSYKQYFHQLSEVLHWYLNLCYICVFFFLLFLPGVIRSIDPVEKCFFILTPLCQSDLSKVNCLLKGSLDLPRQILMTQVNTSFIPLNPLDLKKWTHTQLPMRAKIPISCFIPVVMMCTYSSNHLIVSLISACRQKWHDTICR